MITKKILQQLAIERCRMHVSHITAIHHLQKGDIGVGDMVANLNNDLTLIENLIDRE